MTGRAEPLDRRRLVGAIGAGCVLLAVAVYAALAWGSSEFGGLGTVWSWLTGELSATERAILVGARLPRVVFAAAVGAALAAAGAVFQAVLRNPLADPYILGISGGAALGGTLVLAFGSGALAGLASLGWFGELVGALSPGVAAFVGALGTLALIYAVNSWSPPGRTTTFVLLLTGVIVNAFASSVILFLKSVVSAEKAQELLFYLMGTLSVEGASRATLVVVSVSVVLCVAVLIWYARDLNALSLGAEEAATLGVDVERVRWATVVTASLGVAFAVAFTGLIGFVGLVVPHGVRLLVGPDHRIVIPCCALGGAAFLVAADLLTRVGFRALSTSLPVGVVTAFIGGPLFFVFLWRHMRATRPS